MSYRTEQKAGMKLLKLGDKWEIILNSEISSVWSKSKYRGEDLKKK